MQSIHRVRPLLLLGVLPLLACEAPPEPAPPPAALDFALGGGEVLPDPSAPSAAAAGSRAPRARERFDLGPLYESGRLDAASTLRLLLQELQGSSSQVSSQGTLLSVEAEPAQLEVVRGYLSALQAEVTRRIELDLLVVQGSAALGRDPGVLAQRLARGEVAAEVLVRQRLRLSPGLQASRRVETSQRPVVKVVRARDERFRLEQESIQGGLALHATCWLGARGDVGVVKLELAEQSAHAPSRRAQATFAAPSGAEEVELELIRQRQLGLRGQLEVRSGRWSLLAAIPALEPAQTVFALVRATWEQGAGPRIELAGGRELSVVRIALPEGSARAAPPSLAAKQAQIPFFGASMFGGRTSKILNGLETEWTRQRLNVVKNDTSSLGFGRQLVAHEPSAVGERWVPIPPPELQRRRRALRGKSWAEGTWALLAWDQLHFVHERPVADELRELLADLEAWRNQAMDLSVEWVELQAGQVDLRGEALRRALPRLKRLQPPARFGVRSGSWTEVSLLEQNAALWSPLRANLDSPEVRFLPRGLQVSLRPRRYGSGRVELRLDLERLELEGLDPRPLAKGALMRPTSRSAKLSEVLALEPGAPRLLLLDQQGGVSQGVVVTWHEAATK